MQLLISSPLAEEARGNQVMNSAVGVGECGSASAALAAGNKCRAGTDQQSVGRIWAQRLYERQ